jgi:anionic cell wall polymer biosynthesis LytR-Cps2A-Psr (LCP) family protein
MKSRHWIYLGLFVALITIIAVPIYFYNQPLGPSLELKPLAAAAASSAGEPARQQPAKNEEPAAQNQTSAGACGGSGQVNILYLGQNLPETPFRGSDSIRLMFVNYDAPSIAILSMPPDILVDTNELEDIEATTLTLAFWYGKQPPPVGEPAALRRATQVVAQALMDTFEYNTEKYMTMNQPVFGEMIDTLGGVWVDVKWPVDGSPWGMESFSPGLQLMDGDDALDYIRILQPAPQLPPAPPLPPEWARFNRQNEVVQGIYKAILDPENVLKLPSLIGQFYSLLVTDLKPKELRSLHCMLTEEDVDFRYVEVTADELLNYTPGDDVMVPIIDDIKALILELETWIP